VRSYRWVWLWLGGLLLTLFAFLTAVAIAYFLKQPGYSLFGNGWMVGAFICLVAAYSCFFAAIKGWALPSAVKPAFPEVELEIYGSGSLDIQRESGSGLPVSVTLRSLHARFTNPATGQPARLEALLYLRLVPGSWGRVGEAICPPPDWPLPESLGLTPISMPFDLPPGGSVSGHLVYEIPGYYLDKIDQPPNARLELWDHLSGKRMSLPAEIGSYDKSRMVPSGGGAEVLGPEYESQPDQPTSSG
jgi:hypothetical protein